MAGGFDNSDVLRVQQANDIVGLVGEYVSLKKKGREMVGLCPFHNDHRPSLSVNPAKQIFKCFACGAGGDVLKFVQMFERLTFPQAVERLAGRAGIKLTRRIAAKNVVEDVDPNRLAKLNMWAAGHFQANLYDDKKGKFARDYLEKRKINSESAKKWRLGLALDGDDLIKAAKMQKIPLDLLLKAGLITGQNNDKFSNRLLFPIADVTGRIIAFGGRTLSDAEPKYLNTNNNVLFDKSNCLYGLDHARHNITGSGTAVAVEGYTDCIMAHSAGIGNVVATMGTSFTTGQGRILKRYAKTVVLIFDSDTAGIEAANRALEVCLQLLVDIKVAFVPEGKDPCDYIISAGADSFRKLIESAQEVLEFKWNRLTQSLGKTDKLVDRKDAIEQFLQTVAIGFQAGSLDPIERGLFLDRLSKILGLGKKEIDSELAKRIRSAARAAGYNRNEQTESTGVDFGKGVFAVAQRQILEVLLNEPQLFETVKDKITPELFDVPVLRQIAELLFEMLSRQQKPSVRDIVAGTESVPVGRAIVELQEVGQKKGNFSASLAGAVEAIQSYLAEKRRQQLDARLGETEYLKQISENARKQNPRSIGMV